MGVMFQCPINEVYFGKSRELLEMEKQLDVFRNKYMGRYTLNMRVNSDPELLKFDRMVEKFFGFGCFSMHIVNQPVANGYTLPIDFRFDCIKNGKDLIADTKTFKFRKESDYSCFVCSYSGIMFNKNFTTEEVMAMVMHEIGHNFNSAINKKNAVLTNTYLIVSFVMLCSIGIMSASTDPIKIIIKNTNVYRNIQDKFERYMRETAPNGVIVSISDLVLQIMDIVNTGTQELSNIVRIISFGSLVFLNALTKSLKDILTFLRNPPVALLTVLQKPMKYRSERTADNFAAMYGYGPASISLFNKLETESSTSADFVMGNFDKIPVISTLLHFVELPTMILLTAFDEHPEGVNRSLDQINLLKRELSKEDLDPKMRKVIMADIDVCEKKINDFTNTKKGLSDPYLARHLYNNYLMSINGDLKHFFMDSKDKFNQYDKIFDDVVIK